jgi:hypothetical protein
VIRLPSALASRVRAAVPVIAGGLAGIVTMGALIGAGVVPAGPGPATSIADLPVWGCPGTGSILAMARPNDTMWVTARSADGGWYQVFLADPIDRHGWVDAARVELLADGSALPIDGCPTLAQGSAAPGASTPPSPTASATASFGLDLTTIDACQVVTKPDAEALARTPLLAGIRGIPDEPSCVYNGPVTGPLAQVSVYIGPGAKKTLDVDRALKHRFTTVAGIADEALEEANAIFVRKGTLWVALELVRLNDPAANRLPLERLARVVATRLP